MCAPHNSRPQKSETSRAEVANGRFMEAALNCHRRTGILPVSMFSERHMASMREAFRRHLSTEERVENSNPFTIRMLISSDTFPEFKSF